MGRLAGPQSKGQILRAWIRETKEQREVLDRLATAPSRPLANPPSMRRRMALLCYVARELPDGLGIARQHRPPYTPDMRWLVEHGYLRLERVRAGRGRLWSFLVLSNSGQRRVSAYDLPQADWNWIAAAFHHGMLK